jgi:Ca-activated chloride channel homolog
VSPVNFVDHLRALLGGVTFAHPQALYLLAAVGIILVWSLAHAGAVRRVAAPIMRTVVLALFVLALADPQKVALSEGATRPAVIDVSASITPAMRDWTARLLHDQLKLRAQDPAVIFAGDPVPEKVGQALSTLISVKGCDACRPGATNLEAALERIAASPAARGGPVVLVTDGWQNAGDAGAAINALQGADSRLYIFTPPGSGPVPNVAMTELNLPPALEHSEPFALGVTMSNLNPSAAGGTLTLYENDRTLAQRKVTIPEGQERFDFPVRAERAGLVSYRAVFKPDNPALDEYREDDSLEGWVGIGAQRKVLILTDSSRDSNYLETVVRRMGLQPETVVLSKGQFNGGFKGYDTVVLNNVPRSRLSSRAQEALVNYVQTGGSLAMVGGDESFGLGGYENSAIARAMPVVMKPPQHKERTRALVLIIDKSGSMGRNNKLAYAKAAALTVTKTLKNTDMVAVVGFDSQPFVIVPLEPLGKSRPYFSQLVDRLKARGTTYLLPAMQEAERMLASSGASIKHVVILTDGETGGTAAMYYDLVSKMHHDGGVTISAIAIGQRANLPLLESISRYGGGGFYQTDSPQNLPQLFVQDVKQHEGETTMVEKEFVPYSASPDPILKNLAGRRMPALKGYVRTQLKPGARLSMFVRRDGRQEPIVASWTYGTGKALAVTTDASGRWSSLWIRDNVFAPVWDRLFGWMTPKIATGQKFDVALGYHAGRINMKLTDYSEQNAKAADIVNVIVTAPGGGKSQLVLSQEVPGELSGSIDAPSPGTYYIELKSPHADKRTFPPLAYTVSPAVNAEVPRPAPNYGLLEHLASATGGRLNSSPRDVELTRPTIEQRQSYGFYPLLAAMILLIGEALVRRLTF